jgi:hypothetical protein
MGIVVKDLDLIFKFIEQKNFKVEGLKMCELGNEWLQPNSWLKWAKTEDFDDSCFRYKKRPVPSPVSDETGREQYLVSKHLFEKLGVEHVSVDLNGDDGALELDLTKDFRNQPQDKSVNLYNDPNAKLELGEYNKYYEYFDVVTNCGTTEHIDNQFGHNNYMGWKNLHNLLRVDGLHFSSLPALGYWHEHCNIYYNRDFFEKLCKFCNYKLLYNEIIASPDQYTPETGKPEPNIRAAFVKTKDSKFLTEEEFASFNRIINRPFYAMGPNKVHTPKLW